MKNPQVYIFIAIGFAILLNWITSRFSDLSIGLFNTAIGLLFGITANLTLGTAEMVSATSNPTLIDYAWLLALCQFAFGILIVSSHISSERIKKERSVSHQPIAIGIIKMHPIHIKEASFYAFSLTFSFVNCYIMGLLLLNSTVIFAPINNPNGALQIVYERFLGVASIGIGYWTLLLISVFILRYHRDKLVQLARP